MNSEGASSTTDRIRVALLVAGTSALLVFAIALLLPRSGCGLATWTITVLLSTALLLSALRTRRVRRDLLRCYARLEQQSQAQAQALAETRRELESLIDNLPGLAYRCRQDDTWTMEFASDGCLALTGYGATALIDNREISYEQLIEPADRLRIRRVIDGDVAKDRQFTVSYRIRCADGHTKWVWETGTGVRDNCGELRFLEGIVIDVDEKMQLETERAMLEVELRQREKLAAIGTLASGIAHEINNPVNGILNYAQLTLDSTSSDQPAHHYAAEIASESQRVASIIRNLLAFAHDEGGTLRAQQFAEVANRSLPLLQAVIGCVPIQLTTDVPDDLPHVYCNRQQIQQVLESLVTNAREALVRQTAEGPREIHLTARATRGESGGIVQVTIADNGPGVADEIRDRIFEPFFTTKDRASGRGLGLAASHGIVTAHGGRLYLAELTADRTCFILELPAVDDEWQSRVTKPILHGQ